LRTLLFAALAAILAGCSRQPPPQAATESSTDANRIACLERTAELPIKLATFRIKSSTTDTRSAGARKTERSSSGHTRQEAHLESKAARPAAIVAKVEPPASHVPLPPASPKTQLPAAGSTDESKTTGANVAEPQRTVSPTNSNARTVEAQVAAATALAERVTAAIEKPGSASADDKDLWVVVLMARPDMKSVSDLTGKTIAIDDRYSASNGTVRTALVAAGASFVQLSEGQATAINRLVNGEVSAAVLVLVSAEAAEGFPEIPGFRIFHIPLSPRSLKGRP
jgi:hypothetical protein